jgi:hypothetical protein
MLAQQLNEVRISKLKREKLRISLVKVTKKKLREKTF